MVKRAKKGNLMRSRGDPTPVLAILSMALIFCVGCSSRKADLAAGLNVTRPRIENGHFELIAENTNSQPVVLCSQYTLIDCSDGRNFVVRDDKASGSVLLRSGASQTLCLSKILEGEFLLIYGTKAATRREKAIIASLDRRDFKTYQDFLSRSETVQENWLWHTSHIQSPRRE